MGISGTRSLRVGMPGSRSLPVVGGNVWGGGYVWVGGYIQGVGTPS